METLKIRITFFEQVLGTACGNPDVHREYIASKAPDAKTREEEVAAIGVDAEMEKSMTVFPRDGSGNPIMYDYQIKGFFKDSAGALRKVPGTKCSKIKAFKKEIDGLLFVAPRMIPLNLSAPMGTCTRPLRASTPMGERTALATSETVPAGTTMDLTITALTTDMMELAKECLDYGALRGLGQWRNAGNGRLTWEELDESGNVIGGNGEHAKAGT